MEFMGAHFENALLDNFVQLHVVTVLCPQTDQAKDTNVLVVKVSLGGGIILCGVFATVLQTEEIGLDGLAQVVHALGEQASDFLFVLLELLAQDQVEIAVGLDDLYAATLQLELTHQFGVFFEALVNTEKKAFIILKFWIPIFNSYFFETFYVS
jgi:hypothetical protein